MIHVRSVVFGLLLGLVRQQDRQSCHMQRSL